MNAETLIEVIGDAGYDTRLYSGRGMYGKKCVGFTVDSTRDMFSAIADIIDYLDEDILSDFTSVLRYASYDSMGLGLIIYFPRVEWPEGNEE